MTAPIRVTVIDGHPLFREGVVAMLLGVDGIEVVAEGATAGDALKIAQERAPDVMLFDILIPGGGIEAASKLARVHRNMRIIILTASEDETHVAAALEAGAQGYILKRSSGREIVQAVRAIARGELYVAPNLAAQLLSKKNDRIETVADGNAHGLTSREAEVFALVARGMSNGEIARALGCTERTIKNHMTNILKKLKVRNRLEAVLTLSADGITALPHSSTSPQGGGEEFAAPLRLKLTPMRSPLPGRREAGPRSTHQAISPPETRLRRGRK